MDVLAELKTFSTRITKLVEDNTQLEQQVELLSREKYNYEQEIRELKQVIARLKQVLGP